MKKSDFLKNKKNQVREYMGKIQDIYMPCREVVDAYHGMMEALDKELRNLEDEIKAALEAEHQEGV